MDIAALDSSAWQRISPLLDQALDLEPSERERWFATLSTTHPDIADVVRSLFAQREAADIKGFLENSPLASLGIAVTSEVSMVGQTMGAYAIDAELGRGGMGTVWLAHRVDGKYQGRAAIKLLNLALVGRGGSERFAREGNMLARLSHPNIARLIDAGVADSGQPYLVLEYVEGQPIDQWCDSRTLGIDDRIRLFLDVLAAVQHAHSKLILHRDLKPSNILISTEGNARLLDFGIAKFLDDDTLAAAATQLTQVAGRIFTPDYVAPEQVHGHEVTTATDVYALGVLLYVLSSGRHPTARPTQSVVEKLQAVVTIDAPQLSNSIAAQDEPPTSIEIAKRRSTSPQQLARTLRGDLDNIVAKALKKAPLERYATVNEFAADLKRYLNNESVLARADSLTYRTSKFVRRHRGGVTTALLMLVALIVATAVTASQMVEARKQRDIARLELRHAEAANDFTSLMLEEVGPDNRPLSRDQLLQRGVQLLDARHGGDLAFVADMLTRLSRRYLDGHRDNRALELAERSIAIARQVKEAPLLALSLCNGALIHSRLTNIARARDWLSEAQQIEKKIAEVPLHLDVECLRAQSYIASADGDFALAVDVLTQAHAHHLAQGVRTGLDYTGVLNDLGVVYFRQGRMPEAYRMTVEVGEAFDRGGRGGTEGRAIVRENGAATLLKMGEPRAALQELDAVRVQRANGDSPVVLPATFRVNLAEALRHVGRAVEAQSMLAGAADELIASQAPRAATTALIQEGANLIVLGKLDLGRQKLRRAINLMSQNAKSREGALAQAHALLADLETRSGQATDAKRRLDVFLRSTGYPQDRSSLTLSPALLSAARARLALGENADAERFAADALAIEERSARGRETSERVGESLVLLARLKIAAHRPNEARPLLERALQCFTNSLGTEHSLTREAQALRESQM